jgi:glutathione S-transferase
MKLYYAPHVCSFVPHIVLRELAVPFELVRFDFKSKTTAEGVTLESITPKSYVPILELADGTRLTELAVIIRWLADTHPESKLAPRALPTPSIERVRFDELLHFIATELHKGFAPYTLMPDVGDATKQWTKERLTSRVAILRDQLGSRPFIFGDGFTVADAYAFWALRAFSFLTKTPLEGTLKEYMATLTARPSVRAAIDAEKH